MNAFEEHFLKASAEMARLALDDAGTDSQAEAASALVRAGMSLEFGLRAVVAGVSPSLLFIGRSHSTTMSAAMVKAHQTAHVETSWLASQTSTDTAVVRSLAAQALPTLGDLVADISVVLEQRNAVVHAYAVDPAQLRSVMTSLSRVIAVVLPSVGMKPKRFWGKERLALVKALIDESAEAIAAEVAVKIRAAEIRYAELEAQLVPGDLLAVIGLVEDEGSPFVPPGRVVFRDTCPACRYRAELLVKSEDEVGNPDELELVDFEDGVPSAVLIPQVPTAVQLQCPVCRLALSFAELRAVYPDLADLSVYDVEPRRGTIQEYDEILWPYQPGPVTIPNGPQVG
ncbi:MAG: hypothetical protein K0S70_665 [Microbacterium sp.]|jgi:hypothetical protein|nr:hypothetical protein [Microbacterium sp.]